MRWQNCPSFDTMISMTQSTHRVMDRNSRLNFLPSGHATRRNISAWKRALASTRWWRIMYRSTFEFLARMTTKAIMFLMCCTITPRIFSRPFIPLTHMAPIRWILPFCHPFGYQFAPRYRDIRGKTDTLYGFKNPGDYDEKFILKPTSKANTRLIIEEEDNIQHIFASLALKVTSQSVIIGKLSSYARKNRTKKALWELDNIRRSSYLLTYVDSLSMRRNVQRALNRGESYHKLRRAVAYAYSGRLRVKTELEQQIWADCSRLLANCVIYYNACILSELLERANRRGDHQGNRKKKFIDNIPANLHLIGKNFL